MTRDEMVRTAADVGRVMGVGGRAAAEAVVDALLADPGQIVVADALELWGHDCTRCGNTVPFGEGPCDSCGKDDCLLPLYFKPSELAQMPEGL